MKRSFINIYIFILSNSIRTLSLNSLGFNSSQIWATVHAPPMRIAYSIILSILLTNLWFINFCLSFLPNTIIIIFKFHIFCLERELLKTTSFRPNPHGYSTLPFQNRLMYSAALWFPIIYSPKRLIFSR